ncbi:CRISPR-associated helicase Cas3' [Nocardia thailandica]|uniref:CRISPR-associated helicase Cas3 n=1 Tax=Nocardia thailandica TaxID=257275 RepID=A0ABW6PHW4_9NOCA
MTRGSEGAWGLLSNATRSAWAKSDRDGKSLSLFRHLIDTSVVAELVWDRWLPPHTRQVIATGLPEGLADGRVLLKWLAGVHDLGKLSPAFACQVPDLADAMHAQGLMMPAALGNRRALPHSLAGQVALIRYLVGLGWQAEVAETYAVVVGSHHGMPPAVGASGFAQHQVVLLGEGRWESSRVELLGFITAGTGAAERLEAWRKLSLSVPQQSALTGAVIMADWIASNQGLFPLDERRASSDAAPRAWDELALPGPWVPAPEPLSDDVERDRFVRSRFGWPEGVQPRPLQAACVRIAATVPEPGLMVIEAPMGEGKTEAALAAAEVLAQRFGFGGVFVALPTMATSDAMFSRVLRWVRLLPESPTSVVLAHGRSALNPEFSTLRARGFASIGDDCGDSAVAAHAWYVGKKGPLANIVVGTIDQILRAALKTKHVMLRHLGLANKVVIVDEVHAADAYMSTYLVRSLEWLAAFGVPVLLLSATLPPSQRAQLVQAYQRGRGEDSKLCPEPSGYPQVSVWPFPEFGGAVRGSGRILPNVSIERIPDDDHALAELLVGALSDGGVAGVVCNTVARAQQAYDALREAGFAEDEILLVHARFVASHRAAREAELRARLGPPGPEVSRPDRFVVVGTQVIEQSLDIDVDLLVTDLAPMDLLLQRIGRLHRHQRGRRRATVNIPRCLIRGADWSAHPPKPVGGSRRVYGTARLLRAAAVLEDRGFAPVTLPDDVPSLVEAAYRTDIPGPPDWRQSLVEADRQWERQVQRQLSRAQVYLLPGPGDSSTLEGWLTAAVPDDVEGAAGQAQVRDGEDTIEAIVVQRAGDHVTVLAGVPEIEGLVIPTETAPAPRLAKQVAACTIRLPVELSRAGNKRTVIGVLEDNWYPGWQQTPWLAGELVLELDADGQADMGEYRVEYHPEKGLLVNRKEQPR